MSLSIGFWLMKHQCFTYQIIGFSKNATIQADRGAGATFIAALFEGQSSTIVQCSQEGVGWSNKRHWWICDSKIVDEFQFSYICFTSIFSGEVCLGFLHFKVWVQKMNVKETLK